LQKPADHLERLVLMAILVLSLVSSATGWALMESRGLSSIVLRVIFGLNLAFHPTMFVIVWGRLLSLRSVELACLWFASVLCGGCMALRLYSATYGPSIDIQPLYLWIPVVYVFAFALTGHKSGMRLSLRIFALLVAISLPSIIGNIDGPYVNFTIQMHLVSAVLIVALYFFSSYQHRLQAAQLTVDEMARLANTDELTKLANRRRISEAIGSELVRFARYGHAFSVILIDIDHFKSINDRFGHAVGDKTLVALAARAMEGLRDVDMLGRWGGEEFIVVMLETGFEQALNKARELCGHVAGAPLVGDHAVTISCGVTSVIAGDGAESLLQRADVALYAAKRGGRNRAEGSPQG
jgi:diguanylate cyclase (GGDEF)-like protein